MPPQNSFGVLTGMLLWLCLLSVPCAYMLGVAVRAFRAGAGW
jgi:hypothetical protein